MFKHGIGLIKNSVAVFCVSGLCAAGAAFGAEIKVTITEDVVKSDSECSLREAVEYINQGMPEAGYNGCGGKDASNTIFLSNKEYTLNHQINIKQNLQIKTQYDLDINSKGLGKNNAVIKMLGQERIFSIERQVKPVDPEATDPVIDNPILVSLYELTLEGCGKTQCADQGGLIYNKEILRIDYSKLLNGYADKGGAIYNAGTYQKNKTLSFVTLANTLIQGNTANQGAVIYSEIPQYLVDQSVIRDNEALGHDATLFDARDAFDEETSKSFTNVFNRGIWSSTIFNNKGYIVRVMDAVSINNVTMVLNREGLIVNAPFKTGYVANSILAQNGTLDCKIEQGGAPKQISNNLYTAGCVGEAAQLLGAVKLLAGSSAEGKCDVSSEGILCPFNQYAASTLGYFKPRLLASYKSLADSLVVNKGTMPESDLRPCTGKDQRGLSHPANRVLCDRGAIELTVDLTKISGIGADIFYGETGKMSIADQLNDGELIRADQCQALFGDNPTGKPWQIGCLKIVQSNTVSKGSISITQEGDVTYVPNGNWHGSDEFKILVVTTTTRFNDSINPYIEIPTRIVQSPPNDFKDYKVKTSGGGLGLGVLFGLIGLVGLRRLKK